jgi:large subunit ribosomal protein L14e
MRDEGVAPPPGALVRSLKGRDRNRSFLVLEVRADRVAIADGDVHPVARPKWKNPKHLALEALPPPELRERVQGGRLQDHEVRTWLTRLLAEGGGDEHGQGGHDRGGG